MTFSSLNLPLSTGHGVWTQSVSVTNDDWAAAEGDLTTQAQAWIDGHPERAKGYNVKRDGGRNVLTLDLMRGA